MGGLGGRKPRLDCMCERVVLPCSCASLASQSALISRLPTPATLFPLLCPWSARAYARPGNEIEGTNHLGLWGKHDGSGMSVHTFGFQRRGSSAANRAVGGSSPSCPQTGSLIAVITSATTRTETAHGQKRIPNSKGLAGQTSQK